MRSPALFVTLFLALTAWGERCVAHALQPAYLELRAVTGETYRVFWRIPDVQGNPMAIAVRLPESCVPSTAPTSTFDGGGWSASWLTTCSEGLEGGALTIDGLELQRTDVLVRLDLGSGTETAMRLTPEKVSFVVPEDPGTWEVFDAYLPLGIEHILSGLDHLLFVLALLLLIRDRWRLVGAITAFTLAHSITMAIATLEWFSLPAPPVEAVIALSIMFVASELVKRDGEHPRLSERYPWTVSFSFGLLHGFGFAGALQEIGLPPNDIPMALLSFNLGVEIGQLIFIAVVLSAAAALRFVAPALRGAMRPGSATSVASAYVIGGVSAYWFFERFYGF